ncbi:MAG: hypothetical protein GY850_21080 [bacterium]|nr:hypothetical protein [bacterium]
MNSFQSHWLHQLNGSAALSNDVEMLQTDVMRFFAILCLCLMAIFALVKALPMSPPEDRPTITEPSDLKADAQSLQVQIATLKKKLAKSRTQIQSAAAAAEQASIQAQKAAENEKEIITRLAHRQRELKAVDHSLDQTRRKIKLSELKLAGIVNDIDKKQQISSALKSQIKNETNNLKKMQITLDRANEKMAKSPTENIKSSESLSETGSHKESAREGFILRFASDKALQALILREKVKFYAAAGNKAWQLSLNGGRPGYIALSNPPRLYEMESTTVPPDYMAAFQRQVAAFGRTTVTWGVTLPAQTAASINRLIKGQKGGDLVIMPDGEVVLN